MNKYPLVFALLLGFTGQGQETVALSLKGVVQRAKEQSPSYYRALNTAENRYWNYRQFRAGNLPLLTLNGTLPDYSSSITRVLQDDGTFLFPQREQLFLAGDLSLEQNVALTGGNFSISTGLQRTNVFSPVARTDYFSTPVSISYFQPMVLYNALKWNNRIQPLLYRESKRAYDEDLERIAQEAAEMYFDALAASMRMNIAELNVSNNDTLFKISQGRFNLGKIAENDLLQIELNLLNARNALRSASLDYELSTQNLKRFLNLDQGATLDLETPSTVFLMEISIDEALNQARSNRQAVLEFRRRRLEAEQSIAEARGQSGYNLNVRANFGLNQQANTLNDAYADPLQQQNVAVGVSIPLVDWGRAKSRVKRAKANRDLVEVDVQQDEINFEQEVFLQVMRFNMQQEQLQVAARADTVAQKRYEVTKARYLTGKISITDLNLAQSEKDNARQGYVQALRAYWVAYYTLRRLTLYDFVQGRRIDYEEGTF